MEFLADLVKILVPSSLVLYAMYTIVRAFTQKELQQSQLLLETQFQQSKAELALKQKEVELKNKSEILPIRLQAYERLALLLERNSPAQIIPRLNNPEFTVGMLQYVLVQNIREELAHNLSQQMYVSQEAWNLVNKAIEEMITLINNVALTIPEEENGIELSKKILVTAKEHNINPAEDALQYLKKEIQQFF